MRIVARTGPVASTSRAKSIAVDADVFGEGGDGERDEREGEQFEGVWCLPEANIEGARQGHGEHRADGQTPPDGGASGPLGARGAAGREPECHAQRHAAALMARSNAKPTTIRNIWQTASMSGWASTSSEAQPRSPLAALEARRARRSPGDRRERRRRTATSASASLGPAGRPEANGGGGTAVVGVGDTCNVDAFG